MPKRSQKPQSCRNSTMNENIGCDRPYERVDQDDDKNVPQVTSYPAMGIKAYQHFDAEQQER